MEQRYRNFAYGETLRPDGETKYGKALELLVDIARDPLIPQYIVNADFRKDGMLAVSEGTHRLNNYDMGALRVLVSQSPFLKEANEDPQMWLNKITQNDDGDLHAFAFLLTLLPNIVTLRLPRTFNPANQREIDKISGVLNHLSVKANEDQTGTAPLAKLETLLFCNNYALYNSMSTASAFLAIGSVRRYVSNHIQTQRSDTDEPGNEGHCLRSNLEQVVLMLCHIDLEECIEFTKNLAQLREFGLSYEDHQCIRPSKAVMVALALAETHGNWLEKLYLRENMDWNSEGTGDGITDLSKFKRLKELSLSAALLWSSDTSKFEGGLVNGGSVPRLVDLIPRSVERLQLTFLEIEYRDRAVPQILDALLRDFSTEGQMLLPNLKEICLMPADRLGHSRAYILEKVYPGRQCWLLRHGDIEFYSYFLKGPYFWHRNGLQFSEERHQEQYGPYGYLSDVELHDYEFDD